MGKNLKQKGKQRTQTIDESIIMCLKKYKLLNKTNKIKYIKNIKMMAKLYDKYENESQIHFSNYINNSPVKNGTQNDIFYVQKEEQKIMCIYNYKKKKKKNLIYTK